MTDVDALLHRANDGDRAAVDRLFSLLYPALLCLAQRAARSPAAELDGVALTHECYLRLASARRLHLTSERHLLALAARIMRQVVANRSRDETADKRGGGRPVAMLSESAAVGDEDLADRVDIDGGLNRLHSESPHLARIVDCRVFAGMTELETARHLGLSLRSVQRLWRQARRQLHDSLCTQQHCPH